jgi:hypothetical protein
VSGNEIIGSAPDATRPDAECSLRAVVRAPVRLHSTDTGYDVFLPEHEVEVEDDRVRPLSYGGRVFVFLCTRLVGGYKHGCEREAFVFTDATQLPTCSEAPTRQ